MSSGLENLDGNRFILRYEHPWLGIASDASPEDIAPSQLVDCDGLFIRNGRLCSTNYNTFNPAYFNYTDGKTNLFWRQSNPGQGICAIYTTVSPNSPTSPVTVAIDYECNTWYYDYTNRVWLVDQAAPTGYTYSCSQLIKGIIYIFDWWEGALLEYIPRGSNTLQCLFVGGKYCMTLNEQLVVCNTRMQVWNAGTYDTNGKPVGPPTYAGKQELRANRVSWSAAQEAYTTWNNQVWYYPTTPSVPPAPATPPSPFLDPTNQLPTDRSAGWNGLADVQQEITGCFAMGNVGYILHDTGVTQMTPTASAILGETSIQPFDFTLLWGGKDGMGCTMPRSLAVYGHIAIWGNDNGIYLFSGAGAPQDITGSVKRAIFADVNKFKNNDDFWQNIYGQIINTGVDNNSPEMVYNFYIVSTQPAFTVPITMIIWSYVFKTQAWTRNVVNVTSLMKSIVGDPNYASILSGNEAVANVSTFKFPTNLSNLGHDLYISPLYGGMIFNTSVSGIPGYDSFFLFQFIYDGLSTILGNYATTNLTFRPEEFQVYRQPTIRGVIIRAQGFGTLNVSISGNDTQNPNTTNFSSITLTDSQKTKLYRSYGMYTGMTPQININSTNFIGFITKVHAFGTYAEGEPI